MAWIGTWIRTWLGFWNVVKGDPHVTQQEIATRLNLSLRGVEDMIKRAREKGLIRRVGGKRFGHWEVVK